MGNILGVLITTSIKKIVNFLENMINGLKQFVFLYAGEIFDLGYPKPFYIMDPNVFYIENLPFRIDYSDILVLCVGAIFVSIFAAYIPSKKAAEQKVVDSLRF